MPVTDAPARELGTPGGIFPVWGSAGAGSAYVVESFDENPLLRFPACAPIYDRMRREDGKIGSAVRAMWSPIVGTRARLVGDDVRPEVMALVEQCLDLTEPEKGKARRRRQGIVWRDHLRHLLLMLPHGFMPFEQVYEVAAPTPEYVNRFPQAKGRDFAYLRKLGPRMPRTIGEIRVDRGGGLAGIVQHVNDMHETSGGMPGTVFIPADRLVWYVNDKEGSDWTGNSVLRPAFKHWLIKDQLMRLDAQIAERNGMGIPVVNYDPADPNGKSEALELARNVRAGAEAGAALPNGQTLSLVGVSGSTVDVIPKIEYHDRAAAEALLQHFLTLGHDNGARSLGDTFADFYKDSLKAVVANVEDTTTEYVIRDLVEWNFGPDEPYPALQFDDISSDAAPTHDALKALSDAGLITSDRETEGWVRKRYGIPQKPAPAAGAADAVEDAAQSPVASVGVPALITAGVITPDEGRGMLKLPGRAPGVPGVPAAAAVGAESVLAAADPAGYTAETEKIRANRDTAAGKAPHPFKAAEWTHPNGHPRCLLCGSEEPVSGTCPGADHDGRRTAAAGSRGVTSALSAADPDNYLARLAALNAAVLALHPQPA